jgi:hypothetical protein
MSILNAQMQVFSLDMLITNVTKKSTDYIYEIQIEKNGQSWKVQRTLNECKELLDTLN